MTTESAVSRRSVLAGGVGSLAIAWGGAARASGAAPTTTHRQEMIRRWYAAWEKKDWASVDALAADDFTFSSAAGDDHISKSTYKKQCWDTQAARIDRFELESVLDSADEAFVKYVCRTKNGKAFHNVEHFVFKGDRIIALECYFGDAAGYPSAADKGKG